MPVPWSQLYLVLLTFYVAANNVGVQAINCNAITVPVLETYVYVDHKVTVGWSHSRIPNATYSITSCCTLDTLLHPKSNCRSQCPNYIPIPGCNIKNEKSSTLCTYDEHAQDYQTLYFNLTVRVPGCQSKSEVSTIHLVPENMRMTAVTDLKLDFDARKQQLFASWSHKYSHMDLCYYYKAFEYLGTGKKQKFKEGQVEDKYSTRVQLTKGNFHAYKVFEFCVKLRHCGFSGVYSTESCVEKRSPPAAPSKPLKMLCGQKRDQQNDCLYTVNDKNERNVTLVWELPEKSSWNGIPTFIKIKIKLTSREKNETNWMKINATKTNYTLTKLKMDGRYDIQLQFCSNGGEGPETVPIVLFNRMVPIIKITTNSDVIETERVDELWYVIIAVSSLVVITAVIIIVLYLLRRSQRKQNLASLPHLQQPSQDSAQTGTDPSLRTNPADYDFLSSEEPNIVLDFPDNESSSNQSSSCPLVIRTPDTSSSDSGNVDVEKSEDESGALIPSGDRTSDV